MILLILLGLAGCILHLTRLKFYDDPDRMEEEILNYIPIGTPVTDAKFLMEINGFQCQYIWNDRYSRNRKLQGSPMLKQTVSPKVDFLSCDIYKGWFIVSRRWQVAIVHQKSRVTDVSVSTGLLSP
jgi:hypothetical protein